MIAPHILRRWLWNGRVPPYETIGLFGYGHPRFRHSINDDLVGFKKGEPDRLFDRLTRWGLRDSAVREFGFAIPCVEALDEIAKLAPLVEVGAGTGFWAALLARRGVDIVATDPGPSGYTFKRPGRYHPVVRIDAVRAVRRWPERNVLAVWPCYQRQWAFEAARAMAPGRTLALVSEGLGGCVGTDDLFDYLGRRFDELKEIDIPVWSGIHDRLTIYRKRAASLSQKRVS